MTKKKRTKMQIAHDRARAAELNADGMTEREIADIIGVCQQQIHYDLVKVRDEYKARADDAVAKKAALFDARNEEMFQVLLGEYEKSRETDDTSGDPRFLESAARRLDRYAKFHGLDAPERSEVSTSNPELPSDIADAIKQRYAKSDKPDIEQIDDA